jgi:superfamily II DNA or RNA helicase
MVNRNSSLRRTDAPLVRLIDERAAYDAHTDTSSKLDIVFTTYQTLEREHRKHAHSILFHHWRRIILDEGRFKNLSQILDCITDSISL